MKKKTEWIDPKTLKEGPRRRTHLEPEQQARVEKTFRIIKDATSMDIEKFTDGFLRDMNPEKEIKTWETIAQAYHNALTVMKDVPKKYILGELVLISMSGSDAREKSHLTNDQFTFLLGNYMMRATN